MDDSVSDAVLKSILKAMCDEDERHKPINYQELIKKQVREPLRCC